MIDIAIIEDNATYRQTLSIILQLDESLRLIHKLPNCNELVLRFTEKKPDVVIMDIDLPGISGIKGVWQIKERWPTIKILMLTMFEEEDKIFSAIKAGANGYLLKKDSNEKILESIHAVYKGESAMNGMVAAKVLHYFYAGQKKTTISLNNASLTDREKDVLQLLVKGLSYKQIATQCFITVQTLNSHIKNIYLKLNVHSRAEVAAKYRDKG
ncbi:MAG: response regulator transcription factor [Bacteroidota bacterium]